MMNPPIANRQTARLRDYDYTQSGAYFVTICAFERQKLFGRLIDCEIELSPIGNIVRDCWRSMPNMLLFVELDVFMIMPDHIHAIVWILNDQASCRKTDIRRGSGSLGRVVNFFKGACTRTLKRTIPARSANLWQRNYYEHVVRNQQDLDRIREYILENPLRLFLKQMDGRSNGAPLQ
jgi:putative transposase